MRIGSLENPTLANDTWAVEYDSGELNFGQLEIIISGLSGGVDVTYRLINRIFNNVDGGNFFGVRLNNNTLTIYRGQIIGASDSSVQSFRILSNYINLATISFEISNNEALFTDLLLYG